VASQRPSPCLGCRRRIAANHDSASAIQKLGSNPPVGEGGVCDGGLSWASNLCWAEQSEERPIPLVLPPCSNVAAAAGRSLLMLAAPRCRCLGRRGPGFWGELASSWGGCTTPPLGWLRHCRHYVRCNFLVKYSICRLTKPANIIESKHYISYFQYPIC
jgi:hypothetical protein